MGGERLVVVQAHRSQSARVLARILGAQTHAKFWLQERVPHLPASQPPPPATQRVSFTASQPRNFCCESSTCRKGFRVCVLMLSPPADLIKAVFRLAFLSFPLRVKGYRKENGICVSGRRVCVGVSEWEREGDLRGEELLKGITATYCYYLFNRTHLNDFREVREEFNIEGIEGKAKGAIKCDCLIKFSRVKW